MTTKNTFKSYLASGKEIPFKYVWAAIAVGQLVLVVLNMTKAEPPLLLISLNLFVAVISGWLAFTQFREDREQALETPARTRGDGAT